MVNQSLNICVAELSDEDLATLGNEVRVLIGTSISSISKELHISRSALSSYFAKKSESLRHRALFVEWLLKKFFEYPSLLEHHSVQAVLSGVDKLPVSVNKTGDCLLSVEDLEVLLHVAGNSGRPILLSQIPLILNKTPP